MGLSCNSSSVGMYFLHFIHVWIASAGVLEWFISTSGEAQVDQTVGKLSADADSLCSEV